MFCTCCVRLVVLARITVAMIHLPLPSVIVGRTLMPRDCAASTVVFSWLAEPTSPIVPSGWALKKNGEMSLNIDEAAALVKPSRPSGAFQYGTQPLTKRFGLHALSTIIAAATSVARQKPLLRTLATQ